MKRQILLIAFITISTLSIAQVKPSFGVRAGISSAGMRGDAVNNLKDMLDFANGMITTSDRTGFFAGAYATVPVGEVFSVEPALYYTQKGYSLKDLALKTPRSSHISPDELLMRKNEPLHFVRLPL